MNECMDGWMSSWALEARAGKQGAARGAVPVAPAFRSCLPTLASPPPASCQVCFYICIHTHSLSLLLSHAHIHTHVYKYMYVYMHRRVGGWVSCAPSPTLSPTDPVPPPTAYSVGAGHRVGRRDKEGVCACVRVCVCVCT